MDELTQLAVAAGRGDELALERFVRSCQADVWRLCRALNGADDADDLTQEAFARALGALGSFRGDGVGARAWVLTIARRTCADAVRRRVRGRRLARRLGPSALAGEAVAAPTGAVELELVLAALAPERREAFVLTQWLGLPYAEAAEVCGCPTGTIRSRVARAREDLRAALGVDESGAASSAHG